MEAAFAAFGFSPKGGDADEDDETCGISCG
jgi:hypothetical protein